MTVVAHYEDSIFVISEVFFEPCHSFHVEVIGRFVEEEVIRISEQSLCQHDTHLFLTAQFTHELVVQVFLNAEAAQKGSRIAFSIPTVEFCKLFFQFRYTDTVFVCKIGLGIECIAFVHNVPQNGVSHQYGIEHSEVIPLEVVLTEHRKTFTRAKGYTTLSRLKFTRNSLEEGRLTGTIRTDDTINITIGELHVHILVQHSFTELNGKIGNCNHDFYAYFISFSKRQRKGTKYI